MAGAKQPQWPDWLLTAGFVAFVVILVLFSTYRAMHQDPLKDRPPIGFPHGWACYGGGSAKGGGPCYKADTPPPKKEPTR